MPMNEVRVFYGFGQKTWRKFSLEDRKLMSNNYYAMESVMNTVEQDAERNEMWCRLLGPDYRYADKNQKKRIKRMYAEAKNIMPNQVDHTHNYTIGNCVPTTGMVAFPQKEKKMELEIINTTSTDSVESQKIRYLRERAYNVYYTKQTAIRREFGIEDDTRPANVEELVERIKAGTYTVKDNAGDYYNVMDMIRWRDPSKKTDLKGYKVAKDKLDKELLTMLDAAAIGNPADGLAALQKWEG